MSFAFLKDVAEFFTPVLQKSEFHKKGVLTPEEFEAAGDLLVYKCGTWEWAAGEPGLRKAHLGNPEKQYLVTRRVPSRRRAGTYAMEDAEEKEVERGDEGGGWQLTHEHADLAAAGAGGEAGAGAAAGIDDIDDMDGAPDEAGAEEAAAAEEKKAAAAPAPEPVDDEDDDYVDIDDFEDENLVDEEEDEATLAAAGGGGGGNDENIVRTRTYDVSITYDKYYRTPRVFLFGYDEDGQPLRSEQIMEDISCDHANKTVTVENHPHLSIPHVSIHPCKHASVMKRMIDQMEVAQNAKRAAGGAAGDGGDGDDSKSHVRVEYYLFLFLKFMSSVMPTIDYDFTADVKI